MLNNNELIDRVMDRISGKIAEELRKSMVQALEAELKQNITRTMMQGEFYRIMNSELQDGLKQIYKEISHAKKHDGQPMSTVGDGSQTSSLISEASDQLDEILIATEQAAVQVMDIVENQMELQAEMTAILERFRSGGARAVDVNALISTNQRLSDDFMRIMTALSFQDLTGQRIKKIIAAIKQVERITMDLFVSTGLKIKGLDEDPDRDIQILNTEARRKVSELKGPQTDTKQQDVDDLLAQLGLD
ncbi:chemotaxis protein CheZ [Desulfonatronum thiosulfatophilum]|uniref:Chemotaxis protein CheZ n=1 Tax=Desulfonatronum thiosulfatophilum TaxID=617002 RepID=A0A1G6A037_9BACT|nr:protein phosphatase CheZ [Desulfonatronum thiosulfatophilum]SDB01777.1 chemotaxis protein CheZ [Desulfonatronum thiosulfatophilum]